MSSELFEVLQRIRYDCTAIQAKLSEALRMVSALDLPDPERRQCPACHIVVKAPTSLEDHLRNIHGVSLGGSDA